MWKADRVRKSAMSHERRALRHGLVPLHDLPLELERAGHGLGEHRARRFWFEPGDDLPRFERGR